MKKLMIAIFAGVLSAPAFAFDSLEDLMKDQAKKQAEALKEYIAAHPQAEDVKMAESFLIRNLMSGDNKGEAIAMLEKKYERIHADVKKADLRDAIGDCVMPLLSIYVEDGQKDKAKALMERVKKDFADHENIEQIKKAFEQVEGQLGTPQVGDVMQIKFKAMDGTEVDLATMKGKVVLVDFWATWCGPCVREMPNVKAAYARFHEKGFEIVGISLDDDKDKLTAFLKKENIPWPQSFSGSGWDDALAKKFGVQSIPAMFLIGKDGKVAVVNPRGQGTLEKKVADLLSLEPLKTEYPKPTFQ